MEPSWPRRVFLGAVVLTAAFFALRFAQRKTFTGDFAGPWSAAPGPGPEGPAEEKSGPGEPLLRAPLPSAMGWPTELSEEAFAPAQNAARAESAYEGSPAASSAAGAGAQPLAPSVEMAAAADGKTPGLRGRTSKPRKSKPPARGAPSPKKAPTHPQ